MRAQLTDLITYREPKELMPTLQGNIVPHAAIEQEMPDKEVTLFFYGSYRRGSKEGSVGFVVYDVQGKEVCVEHVQDGQMHSNNEAKYCGLYMGLQRCVKMGYLKGGCQG